MNEIQANIRLRPTRIGFLVEPNDMRSIKRIMQLNMCVWGGVLNPIIPVYQNPPKEWRANTHEQIRGLSVARGYVNFFEPDIYVEAKRGLLEKIGLERLRTSYSLDNHVCTLNEFLMNDNHRSFSEPAFGLNINDVFRHLYQNEQRFELRDKRSSIMVNSEPQSGLAEAIFGVFPKPKHASYIKRDYEEVFKPDKVDLTPDAWLKVFRDNARTPLGVTYYGLEFQQYWYHDPIIFIFDPLRATNLIDLWNIRIEPNLVLPVPVDWVDELSDFLRSVLKDEHRPVQGNPHGMMHKCTIEFARSFTNERAKEIVQPLISDMPKGSVSLKLWRNRIWEPQDQDRVRGLEPLKATAKEEHKSIPVKEDKDDITGRFEALAPEFASQYGGHEFRWVNAVQVSAYGPQKVATVLPYNTYNRDWPQLGLGADRVIVGREGWIFGQRFKNMDEVLKLLPKEEAIIGALEQWGVTATLSDPGHIAKQVLDHLGGLWDVRYLANESVVRLLNKMAGSVRRRKNNHETIEEYLEGRTETAGKWERLLGNKEGSRRQPKLKDYTDRNIIRLGLQTTCPHCKGNNWHSLNEVSYLTSCERCLNKYEFPEADGKDREWKYRVIGPFSIPDYARGSYSSLLTLRVLDTVGIGSRGEMTYSTALDFEFENTKCEADFVALRRKDQFGVHLEPELIVGECKSFGDKGDVIKPKDIAKLKEIAKKLPGAVIIISVMRDRFTPNEKKIITQFVKWCSRFNKKRKVINPVILFTGRELFVDFSLNATWAKLGKPYEDYAEYEHTKDLYSLAGATQAIYLGLPPFSER